MKAIPKISVVVISYNQEKYISRALDSILVQKEYVHEIIVSDDCSIDSTWTIIQKYVKLYPDLIKANQHIQNKGIFGNIESTWDKITGELLFSCPGDDALCPELFKHSVELIKKNKIDYKNEAFGLYFDFKIIAPSGKEKVFHNNLIKQYNSTSLKLRNLVYNRTSGVSRAVFKKFTPINKKIGIFADALIDVQRHIYSNNNYYYPYVGSIYYSGIGIASRTSSVEGARSYLLALDEIMNLIQLSRSDKRWIRFKKKILSFQINPTLKTYMQSWVYFIIKMDFRFINQELRDFKELLRMSIRLFKRYE